MPKEEIIAGLKNAIEKGETLEKAKRSFINAGYDAREVEEAAMTLGGALTKYPQPQQTFQPQAKTKTTPTPPLPTPSQPLQKPQKRGKKRIIILIILLIILLLLLGASFYFRNEILKFFTNLF